MATKSLTLYNLNIEFTRPSAFDYSLFYNVLLFFFTVGLVYSVIAPLVLPFTLVYFLLATMVFKYLLMYVFVTEVETGGQIWRLLFNRLLVSSVLFQIIMIGVLNLKSAQIPSFAIAPLPLVTILFKIICSRRFDSRVYYYQPKIDGPSTTYYNGDNKTPSNNPQQGSKNSVGFRFGDPAFFAELPIPMVHESVRHLLPKLYGGNKSTTRKPFVSRMTRQKSVRHLSVIQLQNSTGGELQFQSIGEKDLELDDSTEGVRGLYKFNEDVEDLNIVDPPNTSYYGSNSFSSHNIAPPGGATGSMNPLKRLSNRFSLNYRSNHNGASNNDDIHSPQRPLVTSASIMDTPEVDDMSPYYQPSNHSQQSYQQHYANTPPPQPQRQMTEDMEYFVAGRAYRHHNPHDLDSSNVIEMANIYRAQQGPYQPPPQQHHSMRNNYNHYIRDPVDAYTGHGRNKNYHPPGTPQSNYNYHQ